MTSRRRRPPPRVLRHLQPCPDCAASFAGTELQHEQTCPQANGIDDICDPDRQYFLDHPGEWHYTRPISAAEYQTMLHIDPAGAATNPDHVHVLRQGWGRIRTFCNHAVFASLALDPDDEAAS
jgi:hypothetical protein